DAYARHYNRHRPHQARGQLPPLAHKHPAPPTGLAARRLLRTRVLGGVINEYGYAARPAATRFRTAQVGWVGSLTRGEGGRDLWWPLVSTVIWTGVAVNGFVTYRRIRTTTLPAITGRPTA
ncbi:hypothetical protein ABT157_36010, partial [Streptomyces viridosporus]